MYAPTSPPKDLDTKVSWTFTYYKLGRRPRTTFLLALMAVFSIKPWKIAEEQSKSECISMLQKSALIIFVNKISRKTPHKMHGKGYSYSCCTQSGYRIHVPHTHIAVP